MFYVSYILLLIPVLMISDIKLKSLLEGKHSFGGNAKPAGLRLPHPRSLSTGGEGCLPVITELIAV